MEARDAGRISILFQTNTKAIEPGWITVETPDGESRLPCDRIIARMGSAPPRKFVESIGVKFTSDAKTAYPQLTPTFETSVPGIYVIGALAGYPLIKHCMNQGYDVVEYISGNTTLLPADEPILERNSPAFQVGGQFPSGSNYCATRLRFYAASRFYKCANFCSTAKSEPMARRRKYFGKT